MEKKKSIFRDILESVLIAVLIVFVMFRFVIMSVEVKGTSMEPLLETGDRGISFMVIRNMEIRRFDICVIDTEKSSSYLVKRVIGLPGETLEYIDNKLYINGEYVEEGFLSDVYTTDLHYELGEDEYFCLGDNRNVSRDSRYYGPFVKKEIKATGIFIYYPFDKFGFRE